MRKYKICFLSSVLCLLSSVFCPLSYANNITVTNAALGTQDTNAHTMAVQFDISWENAWRDATNNDAAWVFIKYSTDSGATWSHATLKTSGTNPGDFSRGTATVGGASKNLDIVVPTDKKGGFVQIASADTGSGTLSATGLQFVWDYGTDIAAATKDTDAATATIRVMAVEMAYIPAGSFDIGDGNGTSESTNAFHVTDNTKLTIGTTLVGSIKVDVNGYDDDQIELTGIGIKGDGGLDTNNDGTINNAAFPTGYNAFYIMKYEISQGQYRDFLNMLTRAQQAARTAITASPTASNYAMTNAATVTYRDTIRNPASIPSGPITFGCDYAANSAAGNGIFNASTDGEWIAANYLSWMDQAAYADWAALRPMTELEFEKAGRGPDAAVNGEYAWGSSGSLTQVNGITNPGAANETAANSGNCVYGGAANVQGPMRGGVAAVSSSTRTQAGASYYGVMELSGNLWERPVTVGNSNGRSFIGSHGDGILTTTASYEGNATNLDWPGIDATTARGVTGATGSGFRGGNWFNGSSYARVSGRFSAANTYASRNIDYGGRCVRTSP
ncbi:MAG: hypothetical protein Q8O22_00380 [Candidatus Omnitrophota bacterium]|nr:hypothetical protein [Candidatus Omnitrophota bacterium]